MNSELKINELKNEIVNLKCEKNDWKQRAESAEKRYKTLSQTSVECLQIKVDKACKKVRKETAKEVADKIKEAIFACLNLQVMNLHKHNELYPGKAEKEIEELTGLAKVILYQINRNVLNKDYGLDEPLDACNQFLAEKDLAQKYDFDVNE